jgi:hypothetical protein
MRTGNKVSNTNFVKEGVKLFILSSTVGLHGNDFLVKESLNRSLKFLKYFRPKLNEINPYKFAIIINEAYVILITTRRFRGWTPNIRKKTSSNDLLDLLVDLGY